MGGAFPDMRSILLAVVLACVFSSAVVAEDELLAEFNQATREILDQMHVESAPSVPAVNADAETQELAETDDSEEGDDSEIDADPAPITQMLLDEKAHKAMVKKSYQSNVKTIYFHLEEIIRKIIAHKVKWTKKYNGDLMKIAKEVLKHKKFAKKKQKKFAKAKGKAAAAKALSKAAKKSAIKAKAKLKQKQKDAKKAAKTLKGLYIKGLKNKAGEVCMIRKIQCMVAKFNGQAKLQKKYCGACKDTKAKIKEWTSDATAVYVRAKVTFGSKKSKAWFIKHGCPKLAAVVDTLYRCATIGHTCLEYIKFKNAKQFFNVKKALGKSKFFKKAMKKFKKDGGKCGKWHRIGFTDFHARDGTCTKVSPA